MRVQDGVLHVDGDLTMATVGSLLEAGRHQLRGADHVVDLSAVGVADSAALALLFAWLRSARAEGHQLSVRGLPDALRSLAALYGVEALLPEPARAS